jgi:cytidine deaminase
LAGSDDPKSWPVADRRVARVRRSDKDRRAGADRRTSTETEIEAERRSAAERRTRQRRTKPERRNDAEWQPVSLDLSTPGTALTDQALHAAAVDARTRAHARFSGFAVGAALETPDGRIITGCNIENATYGLTLCAERVALVKALSDGEGVFTRIVVVADTESPTPPCGPCRQLLWEYCGDIDIILGNLNGPTARYRLSTLLPLPFDARFLDT